MLLIDFIKNNNEESSYDKLITLLELLDNIKQKFKIITIFLNKQNQAAANEPAIFNSLSPKAQAYLRALWNMENVEK